jgi:hypothetical protein
MTAVLAVTLELMRLTLFSILILAGCTDTVPCSSCPAIDGVYAVTWGDSVAGARADGGACLVNGPRVTEWTLEQRTSQVTTTIANVNMGGTLYDTYDMVLTGSESALSYRLRALTIPSGSGADAGVRLQGNFITRTLVAEDPCEVSDAFTAERVSR